MIGRAAAARRLGLGAPLRLGGPSGAGRVAPRPVDAESLGRPGHVFPAARAPQQRSDGQLPGRCSVTTRTRPGPGPADGGGPCQSITVVSQ